jgi:putative FmdB family regulatory protein
MPIYAFSCAECGGFELTRASADAAAPGVCPSCGREGRRVFTPPGLARLAKPLRSALELEEKSAHAPEVVSQKRGRPMPHAHGPTPSWVLSH